MIRIVLSRHPEGRFVCRAQGHAGFDTPGHDIVCAAVTVLLRTAAQTLEAAKGITVTPLEADPGLLSFSAECSAPGQELPAERLATAADFLNTGLVSLAEEFPKNVSFTQEWNCY
jgi:uncharacterized protein YsxB (DUF464 family)